MRDRVTADQFAANWLRSGLEHVPRSASSPVAAAAITANKQALRKMCVGAIFRDSR
jgi:hypothetical protein